MSSVYYAAYGSNLYRPRFEIYLRGGRPPGSDRCYLPNPGGASPPGDDVWFELSGEWGLQTGGRSTTWVDPDRNDRPGIAFLERRALGGSPVFFRAYRITRPQLVGLVQLENTTRPAMDRGELPAIALDPELRTGRIEGAGLYDLLVRLGSLRGIPVVTFTSADGLAPNPPAPVYARHIEDGRAQAIREARRVRLDER